jgi:16S rRNA (cytidine1402-2'-O)-methyltransferase
VRFRGQSFHATCLLKRRKKASFKTLERISFEKQSQIFIETPYRNNKLLEDLIQTLHPETHLCIATDITLPTEYIKTKKLRLGKRNHRFAQTPHNFHHS